MDNNSFRNLVESINNIEEGNKPKHWKGTDKGKPKKDQFVGEEEVSEDYGFLSKYISEEELEEDLVAQMKKEMGDYMKSRKEVEEEGSKPKPFNHTKPLGGKGIQPKKGVKTVVSKEDDALIDNVVDEGILDKAKDLVGWDETDDEKRKREATDRAYDRRPKQKVKRRELKPHEKMGALMDGEGDHEVSMAHSQTQSIIHHIEELDKMIEAMGPDDELQAWFQSKLAIANDYITKMTHYLSHKTEHPVESKKTT